MLWPVCGMCLNSVISFCCLPTLCWVCCIGCGDCADNCPDGLIHLEHGRAVIDPAPCEDCNICSYVCPNGVIAARAMPEYVYLQTKALAAQKGGAAK